MPSQPDLTGLKQRLAALFDLRIDYDDDYTRGRAVKLVELAHLKEGQTILDLATGTSIAAIAAARSVGAPRESRRR